MYNPITTEDFNKWITAESREFEVKCEVYNGGLLVATLVGSGDTGQIISMEWNNVICSNDGLQIGTCCMDEFKMTYRNTDDLVSMMGKKLKPYVGLVCPHENTGDVTVWIPLGTFYVTNTETADEEKTYTLTAYDGMQDFMGTFDATALGVTFPINAWALLTAITTHFGTTVSYDKLLFDLLSSDDYIITVSGGDKLVVQQDINANQQAPLDKPLEGTYRDYIGWIVGLVGANAHMGRNGELWVGRYEDHGYQIPRTMQHMGGAKLNYGGSVTYSCIVSGTDENPLYPTNHSGNAITYTNPYITQEELDILNDAVFEDSNITVTPCDVNWRSDPRIDVGDIVSVEDKDGNFSPTYVMERVMRITGGIAEELHCYGETETQKTLNRSPLVTKFTQLVNDVKTATNPIEATKGTFKFIDNGDGTNGGFTIYENGNNSWLRCTAGGIGISVDGGLTYTNAITKNGVVASQLNVTAGGHTILEAKLAYSGMGYENPYIRFRNAQGKQAFNVDYNDYFKRTSIALNDAYLGIDKATAYMRVGRTGTPPNGFVGGYTDIRLSDPREGHLDGVSIYTDYPDNGYANSGIVLYTDIEGEHNFGRVGMKVSVQESSGVVHDKASMGLYDRLTANERIAFCDDNDDPYIRVHQGTTWRNLRPTRLSINGTYYWLLAEQG